MPATDGRQPLLDDIHSVTLGYSHEKRQKERVVFRMTKESLREKFKVCFFLKDFLLLAHSDSIFELKTTLSPSVNTHRPSLSLVLCASRELMS